MSQQILEGDSSFRWVGLVERTGGASAGRASPKKLGCPLEQNERAGEVTSFVIEAMVIRVSRLSEAALHGFARAMRLRARI